MLLWEGGRISKSSTSKKQALIVGKRRFEAIAKSGFLKKHGIVRNAIKKDMLYFAIPALLIFAAGLVLSSSALDERSGVVSTLWNLVRQPSSFHFLSVQNIVGLVLFVIGLIIMIVGQLTLFRNYSGTVVIREDHQLITHGIYRFTRNPMYLGLIMGIVGLPVYAASLYGFLTMLVLIPIILNRIRLEEELLTEEFQDAYQKYKKTTKKLIPFIY
jgi:protein-S-isoprenylcysteine O-methyltransferase Ste14